MFNNVKTGYTFDDLLLVPGYSEIVSRKDPDISSEITKGLKFDVPIISSNMNTVTEKEMIKAMCDSGATGAIHRFIDPENLVVNHVKELLSSDIDYNNRFGISIGVDPRYYNDVFHLLEKFNLIKGIGYIIIDIAHGHHVLMKKTIKDIKDRYNIPIIAGNICSERAAIDLTEWGADAIKAGIGPGSACSTRIVTGFGFPQLSTINNIYNILYDRFKENRPMIIADGGIKHTGDIVKALAAGADFIMIGGMLAGMKETPGKVITKYGEKFKIYEGMASIDAQATFFNIEAEDIVSEGEAFEVKYKGSTYKNMKKIIGAIKTGFSYAGCNNIKELQEFGRNPDNWILSTNMGYLEGTPHGMILK